MHKILVFVSKSLNIDITFSSEVEVELIDCNFDVVGNGELIGLNSCGQM